LKDFAEQYRLRLAKDECDDPVICGRPDQTNIYEYSSDGSRFGALFATDGNKPPRTELWRKFQSACLTAGMTPLQVGDAEGSFLFNPEDDAQARLAIKVARAKARKRVTPERRAALVATLAAARAVRLESRV
jgi:hypothetical protein